MSIVSREGMFETNSSSTHSLVIRGGEYDLDRLYLTDGELVIYPGEFGWGPEKHTDAMTKASYALTFAKNHGGEREEDMLRKVISDGSGMGVPVFRESNDDYYPWGYIDHQSVDVGAGAFESEESLRDFVFNRDSILVIDHDNH